jgi:hypothetical protein
VVFLHLLNFTVIRGLSIGTLSFFKFLNAIAVTIYQCKSCQEQISNGLGDC